MTRKHENFGDILTELGYQPDAVGSEIFWKISQGSPSAHLRTKISILQRKNRFTLDSCSVTFDLKRLVNQLETVSRRKFQKVNSSSASISSNGRIRIVLEVAPNKPGNDKRSVSSDLGTIIGWTTNIAPNGSSLIIQITDAFFLGSPIRDWWSLIQKTVVTAINPGTSSLWKVNNLFETSLPVWLLPCDSRSGQAVFADLDPNQSFIDLKTPKSINLTTDDLKLSFNLTVPDSLIEQDLPIEILEARETSPIWATFDRNILERKDLPKPNTDLTRNPTSIFARLAAFPELLGQINAAADLDLNKIESFPLTALTGVLLQLNKQGRSHDLIKVTSDLLRNVSSSYGPLHSHAPFRNILPEFLGDLWSTVDHTRAIISWQRAVGTQQNKLRILTKIACLSKEAGDAQAEYDALIQICEKERRGEPLKKSVERIIELSDSNKITEKNITNDLRRILELAVRRSGYSYRITLKLVALLRSCGEHRKAITLLETSLSQVSENMSPQEIAEIHAEIGFIWKDHEQNIILASRRFVQATTEPSVPSSELLDKVENFFFEIENTDELKRLFSLRQKQPNNRRSIEAIERTAKHMNKIGHHKDAISAVKTLMGLKRFQQWYCDIISDASEEVDINWVQLTTLMDAVDATQLPKDVKPLWQLVTGRCALKSAETHEIAIKALSEPKVIPMISKEESFEISRLLIKRKNHATLTKFISTRLPHASENELLFHLDNIVSMNATDEDGLFDQAIANQAHLSGNLDRSLNRIKNLKKLGDARTITCAIQAHRFGLSNVEKLVSFFDSCIDLIKQSGDSSLTNILRDLIKHRDERQAFAASERDFMIESLAGSAYPTIVEELLLSAIESGSLGTTDEKLIYKMFGKSPATLAKWHALAFKSESSVDKRHVHCKQSVQYYLSMDAQPRELVDLICELCEFESVSISTLEFQERLCVLWKTGDIFIKSIEKQLRKNPQKSDELLYWGIRFINANSGDREFAATLFSKWSKHISEPQHFKLFTQGHLYLGARNLQDAQRCFVTILKDPDILQESAICLSAIDAFSKTKPPKSQIASLLQTLTSWADTSNSSDITSLLLEKAIQLEVASTEHLNNTFVDNFNRFSASKLASIAIQALTQAERSPSGVMKQLEAWGANKIILDNRQKWQEVVACLTNDHLLRQLRRSARGEILYMHARNLFDNEEKRFDAIPHFELIALENPMDSRVWIPLYALYEESDSKQKMVGHLERIIPLIERDTSILEKTPFNIESLKATLKRTRRAVVDGVGSTGLPDLKPTLGSKSSNFELNDHAARLQRGWVEAIPVVKISAIASQSTPSKTDKNAETLSNSEGSTSKALDTSAYDGTAAQKLDTNTDDYNATDTQNKLDENSQIRPELRLVEKTKTTSALAPLNWRELVAHGQPSPGLTKKIMKMAFASELEKHIAVQAIGLICREANILEDWHWQIWRKFESFQYPTTVPGRLPKELGLKHYGGHLHRLIKMITPVILRANRTKLKSEALFKQFGLSTADSRQCDASHPALSRSVLKFFEPKLVSAKLKLFDTKGLGSQVFFDVSKRALHFDGNWQLSLPPSVVAYRILEHLAYFKKGFPIIPFLDVDNEIIPVIHDIRAVLSSSGVSRLRIALGMDYTEISHQLKSLNQEQLGSLLGWMNDKTSDHISQLLVEMRMKAFAEMLGATLDLVGICESITGHDLCDPNKHPKEGAQTTDPLVEYLIKLTTKMNL